MKSNPARGIILALVLVAPFYLGLAYVAQRMLRVDAAVPATPTITATGNELEPFLVTFPAGALQACTIFQDQAVLAPDDPLRQYFADGHYAPRHCWGLPLKLTSYTDDWDFMPPSDPPASWKIWVLVQYPTPESRAKLEVWDGQTDMQIDYLPDVLSNVIEVKR